MKQFYLLITLFFACCICKTNVVNAQIDMQDSLALVDFYDSTDGPNWKNNSNWLTVEPVANWYGISIKDNRVVQVDLEYNHLKGMIPCSIVNLSGLKQLTLYGNQLHGSIPACLGNMVHLESLGLFGNNLSGVIPPELGNLVNLIALDLGSNNLGGSIPLFEKLVHLNRINLSFNHLTGKIPSSFAELPELGSIDLSQNKLHGTIPEFGSVCKYFYGDLDLSYNQLNGKIPRSLGNIIFLQYAELILSHNQLTGNIPAALGNLSVGSLRLDHNLLSGEVPLALHNIHINNNNATLDLSNNNLSGTIKFLKDINGGYVLRYIYLNNNNFSGSIPKNLINNTFDLWGLNLSHNQLTGNIPHYIGDLGYLQLLDLSYNNLSGNLPPFILNTGVNLRYLYLNHNKFAGTIAEFDPGFLLTLRLDSNQFHGNIPEAIGYYPYHQELHLEYNNLGGEIPSSIGNIENLTYLSLSHNNLTGKIPQSFSKLNNLVNLDISRNRLTDSVPEFFSGLKKLKTLELRNNHFVFDGIEKLSQHDFKKFRYADQRKIFVHQNNNTLSVYAGGTLGNNTYKWYKDGALIATINGDSTYTPTSSGAYTVQVTNSVATQLTLYSDTVTIGSLIASQLNNIGTIRAGDKNNFSVYPNPATTTATIVFRETGSCIIKLADVSGKVLQMKTVDAVKESNILQLDISGYVKGVYFITIVNGKNETKTLLLNKQ
jgi:Leucine-rich repeat (LRR) protein